eukprot:1753090-Amphidinium_carterae.2
MVRKNVPCGILGKALNHGACDWMSSSHATLGHCTGTTLFLQLVGSLGAHAVNNRCCMPSCCTGIPFVANCMVSSSQCGGGHSTIA